MPFGQNGCDEQKKICHLSWVNECHLLLNKVIHSKRHALKRGKVKMPYPSFSLPEIAIDSCLEVALRSCSFKTPLRKTVQVTIAILQEFSYFERFDRSSKAVVAVCSSSRNSCFTRFSPRARADPASPSFSSTSDCFC